MAFSVKGILVLTFFQMLPFAIHAQQSFVIANDGVAQCAIILGPSPTPLTIKAAKFLQGHILQSSHCQISILQDSNTTFKNKIYFIDNDTDTAIEYDGFKIACHSPQLTISARNGKGCMNAVSELLEHYFGIQYLSPSFIIIPNHRTITIPSFVALYNSPNQYRNVHGRFCEDENYKNFHRLHTIDDMFAENYYVHTFKTLIPWQKYFTPHPEYFALINNKRCIDQLCPSNPDVARIIIGKLKEEMLLQPNKRVWSVSQNDNYSYCKCHRCSKIIDEEQSESGPIIRLVNNVAAQFPKYTISTLAYQYSRKAPALTKPAANVQIMLCTIELNRAKPIVDDSSSITFVSDMIAWGKICANIYLWDYTVDFAHAISPFPNLHTLQSNIKFFCDNNVVAHFQQSNTGYGHEFSELKSFVLSKLLWNPTINFDSLVVYFTDNYYGSAAPLIRDYIYHMQQELANSKEWLDIYGPPTNHKFSFLSRQNISLYNQLFDEAEMRVAKDSACLLHVQEARMSLQYAIMEIGKNDMYGARGWYEELDGKFVLKAEMAQSLEKFFHTSALINCEPVNESGLTALEYYGATKRFIDIQIAGNKAFRKKVLATPAPSVKYSEGNLTLLTNGVRGANDFKVHWLGWESQNFELLLELDTITSFSIIELSTLYDPKSWILHPSAVSCLVSTDGNNFQLISKQSKAGDQRNEPINFTFKFINNKISARFIKFRVEGTLHLFNWHPSAGGGSWVFVDEIIVK